ncbi:glycosyltransferase [Arthrobacter sp. NPDC093128]|uniref:glycosyltransferase n=1 Tax=Arthrobacter sp. NPDC093128 TaxID=3154979 RepID=UPI00342A7EDF
MTLTDIAVVVVHHRSYDTLPITVERLISEGIVPSNLLVVDNSEDPDNADRLKGSLPIGVNLVFSSNSGYGAAVNHGVSWHAKNTARTEFLLISTHESLPETGAVQALQTALLECGEAAVVGPALVTGVESETIWSSGGYLSPLLGLPRHRQHKAPRAELVDSGFRSVEWVDGAFLMIRRSVIEENVIDESYFLYMEETDHQQALRRSGWKVLIQPSAIVWQSSGGVPPYYQTRNIQLFQDKNGTRFQRAVSAPYIVGHSVLRDVVRRNGTSQWKQLIAGWRAGTSFQRDSGARSICGVRIVNPLGGALSHYTNALAVLLRTSGAHVEVQSIEEPSLSGRGRLHWLLSYVRLLSDSGRSARKNEYSQTLVTWPVVGFVDLLLVRVLCGKSAAIVYHDPKPLVRSIGSGRLAAKLVSMFPSRPRVVVHSAAASEAMRNCGLDSNLDILAHPMLPPLLRESESRIPTVRRPVIRVLGQFKQDRDLEVLQALAAEFEPEYDLEIAGRGWPAVDGWKVDSRFVTEIELDELVRSSDVIVIPYKRFYQSGIAIRALEAGTPIVGRAGTSLVELYGPNSSLLVTDQTEDDGASAQAWAAAVRYAVLHGKNEVADAANAMFKSVAADWQSWTSGTPTSTRRN